MVDGDESRSQNGHQSGNFIPGASFWPVCCSHCVYPPGDGRSLCFSACTQAALVSLTVPTTSLFDCIYHLSLTISFIFVFSGWSFRISSTAGWASSFAPLPSLSCLPALSMIAYCEKTDKFN